MIAKDAGDSYIFATFQRKITVILTLHRPLII
jgi:hypothetical protein